jgi:hypothetical protein
MFRACSGAPPWAPLFARKRGAECQGAPTEERPYKFGLYFLDLILN